MGCVALMQGGALAGGWRVRGGAGSQGGRGQGLRGGQPGGRACTATAQPLCRTVTPSLSQPSWCHVFLCAGGVVSLITCGAAHLICRHPRIVLRSSAKQTFMLVFCVGCLQIPWQCIACVAAELCPTAPCCTPTLHVFRPHGLQKRVIYDATSERMQTRVYCYCQAWQHVPYNST